MNFLTKILLIILLASLLANIAAFWPKQEIFLQEQAPEGEIKGIYFCPENNCEQAFIGLVGSAGKSVHCAVYDLSLDSVKQAFFQAKLKGVDVKIVADDQEAESKDSIVPALKENGLAKTDKSKSAFMHDKFCVIDSNKIWVGSTNLTFNDTQKNNNNFIVIENSLLAGNFEKEFNELWEGNFGLFSPSGTVNDLNSGYEAFFCPEDSCEKQISRYAGQAKKSIDCMFFVLTLDEVEQAFLEAAEKGVKERFIFEQSQIQDYSSYWQLVDKNNVSIVLDKNPGFMHNKLCVFDDEIVLTGSMNPSKKSSQENDESIIFIKNSMAAKAYSDYFKGKWLEWQDLNQAIN
ncbi:hypothetical protein HZB89_01910 [archaeon]|nr:hypothetical protein [archaeon]